MTEKDRTRQKLVESMRKTKASTQTKSRKKVKKKSTRRRAPATRKTASRRQAANKGNRLTGVVSPDPYQAFRRVWPD